MGIWLPRGWSEGNPQDGCEKNETRLGMVWFRCLSRKSYMIFTVQRVEYQVDPEVSRTETTYVTKATIAHALVEQATARGSWASWSQVQYKAPDADTALCGILNKMKNPTHILTVREVGVKPRLIPELALPKEN